MAPGQRDAERDRRAVRERRHERRVERNAIDRLKRATALVLGSALFVRGLRRRSFRGIATVLAGGWLVSRALGGRAGVERTFRAGTESGKTDERTGPVSVSRSITVGRPADELYEAWRDPERFSQVVGHFADVAPAGEDRLRWIVHGPRGRDVSWETRTVEDEPGAYLRWETPPDAVVASEGSVRFRDAPGDRGTVVTLTIRIAPPGGEFGTAALSRLDVVPEALVGTALDRFKSLAETGEIPTLEGNPSGRGRGDLL